MTAGAWKAQLLYIPVRNIWRQEPGRGSYYIFQYGTYDGRSLEGAATIYSNTEYVTTGAWKGSYYTFQYGTYEGRSLEGAATTIPVVKSLV